MLFCKNFRRPYSKYLKITANEAGMNEKNIIDSSNNRSNIHKYHVHNITLTCLKNTNIVIDS